MQIAKPGAAEFSTGKSRKAAIKGHRSLLRLFKALSKTSFKKTPRGPSMNGCTYKHRDTCTKTTVVMDLHTTGKSSWTYRKPKWRRRSRTERWRLEVKRLRTVGHRKRTENPGIEDDDPETAQGQADQRTDSRHANSIDS